MEFDIKPCPFCGHTLPFTHITFSCAVIECPTCQATMRDASAQTMYKRDELPEHLVPYSYEPVLLTINKSGVEIEYPHHGYVGVNVTAAFHFSGVLDRWNKRVDS